MSAGEGKADRTEREKPKLLIGLVVTLLLGSCGAEGIDAPLNQTPEQRCITLDQALGHLSEQLDGGALDPLASLADRFLHEREGTRTSQLVDLFFGILQSFPRAQAMVFEYDLLLTLVERIREQAVLTFEYLGEGPPERLWFFQVVSQALAECPQGSIIPAVQEMLEATDLMAAIGTALTDPTVVGLLTNIPTQPEGGRDGFVAMIGAVSSAIRSVNFQFSELRSILSFFSLDEPPISWLLVELEEYLAAEKLEHLRSLLDCIGQTSYEGLLGIEIIGGLFYDLLTLQGSDPGTMFSLVAPIINELQNAEIQVLMNAAVQRLMEDLEFRRVAIELALFFFRQDNTLDLVRSLAVLFQSESIDDIILVMAGITIGCTDPPRPYLQEQP
ncbi:MAG: hypothetical protein JW797_15555 [Bradymonadales bacterium]|nr:hypothetical protein [Bradymonadales bacterium]